MNDYDALERLRADILELFPPGPKRDRWLAWLAEVAAESRRADVPLAAIRAP